MDWFLDKELTSLPWYFESDDGSKCRTIVRSPLSREIQEKTVTNYMVRMRREGLSQRVAGEAVMKWRSEARSFPLHAGAFNHRAESFYRCHDEMVSGGVVNPYIQSVLDKGLTRIPVLHWGTSDKVFSKLIKVMNRYHDGSGDSFVEYFQESLDLESEWKAHAVKARITSHNPRYAQLQQDFILAASKSANFSGFFSCWEHYKDTLALVHTLVRLGVKDKFIQWANKNVSFLEDAMTPQKVITMMHSITLLVLGNTRKYYSRKLQSIIVMEALKFTVPRQL
ncbi:unnamed protein product [Effrenium voratum]|uniref:Uncharacterized protein n=1 Tax=Effrenium voratum TaxID=2562239 RepID=A0AA36MY34_9DINO|nr:unnamed protein product [Effrenium voratum]